MLENYSKYINELFDKPDSVLMIDADGYATHFPKNVWNFFSSHLVCGLQHLLPASIFFAL